MAARDPRLGRTDGSTATCARCGSQDQPPPRLRYFCLRVTTACGVHRPVALGQRPAGAAWATCRRRGQGQQKQLWLFADNHVKQRGMHFELAVVLDEAELAELVHEVVDARAVVPTRAAITSWLIGATTVRSSASWPTWDSMMSRRANRFSLELNSWSTRSASIWLLRSKRNAMNRSDNSGWSCIARLIVSLSTRATVASVEARADAR